MTTGELAQIEKSYALDSAFAKHANKPGTGRKLPRVVVRKKLKDLLAYVPVSDWTLTQ